MNLHKFRKYVQLSILNELEQKSDALFKSTERADNDWKNYQDYLSRADKPFSNMMQSYDQLDGSIQSAEGVAKRFLKASEDLGIDARSNRTYQNIKSNIKTAQDIIRIINSFDDPSTFQR